jgi:valyl-tRNA synthetase
VLVTAPDIIFFWVARMIIAGLEFQPGKSDRNKDNIAFRDVYFTGLIRDKQGRKMSKSLGNSPDPRELIDKYGADGLRFGLMRIAPSGQDIRFDEKQIEEGRNFATKLWNVARFRQMQDVAQVSNLRSETDGKLETCPTNLSIYAVEVLARLNETIEAIEAAYREYQFNTVVQQLYDFVWSDYCDWFVEAAKTEIFGDDEMKKKSALAVMDFVLSAILWFRDRHDPIRGPTKTNRVGRSQSREEEKTCLRNLRNSPSRQKFARGSTDRIQSESQIRAAIGCARIDERKGNDGAAAQRIGVDRRS